MVYLWIFLGLLLGIIALAIANVVLTRVKRKRANLSKEKGEECGHS